MKFRALARLLLPAAALAAVAAVSPASASVYEPDTVAIAPVPTTGPDFGLRSSATEAPAIQLAQWGPPPRRWRPPPRRWRRYPPPPRRGYYRAGRGHVNWCLRRYRSYNPRTDLYKGYDGRYHRCRSPYR